MSIPLQESERNVKVVVLKPEDITPRPDLVGQWLDESHFNILVEEDMDVYLPPSCASALGAESSCEFDMNCSTCQHGLSEKNIVFKFRKNFFSEEEAAAAYAGLRDAAVETQNRGIAGGPRASKSPGGVKSGREWVTDLQMDILDYFAQPVVQKLIDDGEDEVKQIIEAHKKNTEESTRGVVWLIEALKEFNWDNWLKSARERPREEVREEAVNILNQYISKTTYANSVNSGIAGWYDRYPRIPYGRATSYTEHFPEKFEMAYPFLQSLAKGFKEMLPWRYGNQMRAAQTIDQHFVVPETPFTTITVNKNFRTAAHYDPANMDDGFANLCVMSNNDQYEGGYLVFPEIGYAANIRPRDLLLVNNMAGLHGNTEIKLLDPSAERLSIIAFFHEGMLGLGSWEYEQTRRKFVDTRRKNEDHQFWRPRWNGVSEGMWESEEWYNFLESELGRDELVKYHPAADAASLEDFFA